MELKQNILNILKGEFIDESDGLDAKDPEFLRKSPLPIGYESVQEQKFLYSNLFAGFNPTTDSLLDIGAGRGDLFGFITNFYQIESFNYTGIERNPVLCDIGYQKYGLTLTNGDFQKHPLPKNDWVVAAGTFFGRRTTSEPGDMQLLLDDIRHMYNAANTGVVFNILSPINNEIQEGRFYVHPGLMLDMLIEDYGYVTIKHNYSQTVYTVTIYKY